MAQKEGWLKKEGYSVKTWKKRWVVLNGTTVVYYSGERKKKKMGEFSVKNAGVSLAAYKHKKNSFQVATLARTYHFSCDDSKDAKDWVKILKQASAPPKKAAKAESKATNGSSESKGAAKKKMTVEDFQLLKVIGQGSFGKVFLVKKNDNQKIYALKQLRKDTIINNNEVGHIAAEKSILMRLKHPFLIGLDYAFQTVDHLYFVMPYINGGELFFHLQREGKFSEDRVRFYAAQIASGIGYLHSKNVIYRDLKPENLLLTSEGNIILTDFGLSKEGMEDGVRTETFCGTPEYLAPEVLEGGKYNKSVDWWSFGTLMYEMLNGLPPFFDEDVQEMYVKIVGEKLRFPSHFSREAKDILTKLLDRNPATRLQNLNDIKAHPFFKPIDFAKLEAKQITPEFIPPTRGEADTQNVSDEFLNQKVSLIDDEYEQYKLSRGEQSNFAGFTYVPGSS